MDRDEIKYYINKPETLKERASKICSELYGNRIFVRGLIEFSNLCDENCLYCGIRKGNRKIKRYKLSLKEIEEIAKRAYEFGIKTLVLQSGERGSEPIQKIVELVEKIREIDQNIRVTLSAGIRSYSDYKILKDAGVNRYLMRFETSDEDNYKFLRDGLFLKDRLLAIDNLRELGFEVGSGFMTGLPNETEETLINNILLCQKYGFDMVGIGPFIPSPDTPLADFEQSGIELTLKAAALIRIALPLSNIPATTAAASLVPNGRELMLTWGANVIMPNITPKGIKENYLLYPNKVCINEDFEESIKDMSSRAESIGKVLDFSYGDSKSFISRMATS